MNTRLSASALFLLVPQIAFAQAPDVPLDQAIAELKAAPNDERTVWFSGETKYSKPLLHLSQQEVDPKRRAEVAALLQPLILAEDRSHRGMVLKLVAKWGTELNVPT